MYLFRIGLMGNPSDGFNGKTIALTISNFWADATLTESTKLVSDYLGIPFDVVLFTVLTVYCLHDYCHIPMSALLEYHSHNIFVIMFFKSQAKLFSFTN